MNKPNNMLTPPEIVDILKKLKLTTMANDFMEISEAPQYQELDFEERMGILLFNEMTVRNQRRMMRYLQRSGLKKVEPFFMAEIDKLIKNKERNLDERLLNRLLTCRWIENSSNVLITGPTGTGKTWVIALLRKCACQMGYTVKYIRAIKLIEEIIDAAKHQRLQTYLDGQNRNRLLIIDDLGGKALDTDTAASLLELFEKRYGNASVIVASQIPLKGWHDYLETGENDNGGRNSDAIIDRLFNCSYKIALDGPSLREVVRTVDD